MSFELKFGVLIHLDDGTVRKCDDRRARGAGLDLVAGTKHLLRRGGLVGTTRGLDFDVTGDFADGSGHDLGGA